MKELEERIRKDGVVKAGGILRVDSFLNHQIDTKLYMDMALEWKRLFAGKEITKVLTVEASGIGIACMTGYVFGVPVVFAKKSRTSNLGNDVYSSLVHSYTHGNDNMIMVSKDYLNSADKVLIIDDFLASGQAIHGLMDIVAQAGAETAGVGIMVEKVFQGGGEEIRAKGVQLESLARVISMDPEKGVEFAAD